MRCCCCICDREASSWNHLKATAAVHVGQGAHLRRSMQTRQVSSYPVLLYQQLACLLVIYHRIPPHHGCTAPSFSTPCYKFQVQATRKAERTCQMRRGCCPGAALPQAALLGCALHPHREPRAAPDSATAAAQNPCTQLQHLAGTCPQHLRPSARMHTDGVMPGSAAYC
jgi:hypothetical protein